MKKKLSPKGYGSLPLPEELAKKIYEINAKFREDIKKQLKKTLRSKMRLMDTVHADSRYTHYYHRFPKR